MLKYIIHFITNNCDTIFGYVYLINPDNRELMRVISELTTNSYSCMGFTRILSIKVEY